MNLFEVFRDAVKPYLDGEKHALHVGEVMNLWFYLTGTEQTLRGDQVAYNTCQDPELKEKIRDIIENVHTPMINELKDFFKNENIPLPATTPEKPIGDYSGIPEGGKLSDEETANLIAYNLVVGITAACRGITESVRSDVGAMFLKYQLTKVTFSITFKELMTKKGWLKTPPYYEVGQYSLQK